MLPTMLSSGVLGCISRRKSQRIWPAFLAASMKSTTDFGSLFMNNRLSGRSPSTEVKQKREELIFAGSFLILSIKARASENNYLERLYAFVNRKSFNECISLLSRVLIPLVICMRNGDLNLLRRRRTILGV